ncbi:activator of (R)-2-hydroxyglutaryl-CoA dehydratase [Cutibacterium acnes JCM 18918]|nr:activator of (R)-2-hydroxyglutaryl-CoA dehydratase [Cutibacterium acnes JCM 18918]
MVASYPEVIRANVESLRDKDVELISPFLSLADPDKLAERLAEVFADDDVTVDEARRAIAKGLEEDKAFHDEIRKMGEDALAIWPNTTSRESYWQAVRTMSIRRSITEFPRW